MPEVTKMLQLLAAVVELVQRIAAARLDPVKELQKISDSYPELEAAEKAWADKLNRRWPE